MTGWRGSFILAPVLGRPRTLALAPAPARGLCMGPGASRVESRAWEEPWARELMQEASSVRSDRVTSSFVGVEIAFRALG